MKDYRSLSHTKWDCKYHVVFIPKYRRKRIFGKLRGHLGEILHELAARRRSVEHRLAEHQRPPMVDERESTSTSFDDLPARLLQHRALFLEEMAGIRPQLHRFCSRMGGSLLDGEDIVQDVLVQAFYKLPTLEDVTRLRPWLFRIAHNKCIDHLRRHRGVELVPVEEDELDVEAVEEPAIRVRVGEAFATLVTSLPPKERASVVLKDVLDYPLS